MEDAFTAGRNAIANKQRTLKWKKILVRFKGKLSKCNKSGEEWEAIIRHRR